MPFHTKPDPPFDPKTGKWADRNAPAEEQKPQPLDFDFTNPAIVGLLVIPLLIFGAVYTIATATNNEFLLLMLIAFVAFVLCAMLVASLHQHIHRSLLGVPTDLRIQLLLFIVGTLIVGFVAPIHLLPIGFFKFVLVMGMLFYGLGLYYEHTSELQVSSVFKRISLVSTAILIAFTLGHWFDIVG